MEQRALAFDEIPAATLARRGHPLRATGDEIGDQRIDGNASAGDENARLAGRAKVGLNATTPQFLLQRERRVHLADRTIRADSQQPAPGARLAVANSQRMREAA